MPRPSLILASASPSRRQLLANAGLVFDIEPSGIDEEEVKRSLGSRAAPQELASTLAEMKAVKVSARHPDAMVVGADSTLACNGRLFDKPPSLEAARKQLQTLRGQTHELFSSVVVARSGVRLWHWSERARLTMRPLNDGFIDTYLARTGDDVLTSVGAYQLEGLGAHLFSRVDGDYFTILGLPLLPLLSFLSGHGIGLEKAALIPYEALVAEARGRPFACIVGWPVEHSRSPALHGYWLKRHSIDGYYGRLPVEPNAAALQALVAFLKATPNARGCNLTLPHKIDIMPLLDRIHPDAERIGAVNTVIKHPDGSLEGRNSDAFGFLAALQEGAPAWRAAAGPVVVLGAGGAARAVVCSLVDAGVPELRLINRTQAAATSLGLAFTPHDGRQIMIERWDERSQMLDGATLLVNTTSLGMKGQPPLEIDLARLPKTAVVDDIVSVPLETPLLAAARARGNVCIEGIDMLLHQGRMGFEAWFGQTVEVTAEQRDAVLAT